MSVSSISAQNPLSATTTNGPKLKEAQPGGFLDSLLKGLKDLTPSRNDSTETAGSATDVDQVRLRTTQSKMNFQRKLVQKLLEHGVDLSQPLTLQGDGFGGVKVTGDHPDREAIEAVFEDDADLRQEFQQLAAQADELYQLDRTSISTSNGPGNAAQSLLADRTQPQFSLIVRNGEAEMAYLRAA